MSTTGVGPISFLANMVKPEAKTKGKSWHTTAKCLDNAAAITLVALAIISLTTGYLNCLSPAVSRMIVGGSAVFLIKTVIDIVVNIRAGRAAETTSGYEVPDTTTNLEEDRGRGVIDEEAHIDDDGEYVGGRG